MDAAYMRQKRKALLEKKWKKASQVHISSKRLRGCGPLQDITNTNNFGNYSSPLVDVVLSGPSSSNSLFKLPRSASAQYGSGSHSLSLNHSGQSDSYQFNPTKTTFNRNTLLNLNLEPLFNEVAENPTPHVQAENLSTFSQNQLVDVLVSQATFDENVEYCELNNEFHITLTDEDWDSYLPNNEVISYEDLGDPVHACSWCGAMFWSAEALRSDGSAVNPVYSLCCSKGKVQLPYMPDPPQELHDLFFSQHPQSKAFLLVYALEGQ